jgi:hypothetical protein
MTSKIIVNNIQSDTGVSTVTISSPVNLIGGITGGGFAVGTGASIASPATNILTISTNNTERIRVGAAGSIGIGTDNPTKFIDITGVHSGINTTGRFVMSPHSSGWDTGVTSGNIHHHYIDNFRIYSGQIGSGTERFKVDSSGRVTKPFQPYFYARTGRTGGDGYTNNPYRFEDVLHNVGGHFVTSGTGAYERFVAPVAGIYCFQSNPGYKQTSVDWNVRIRINGTQYAEIGRFIGSPSSHSTIGGSVTLKLSANDYVDLNNDGGAYHINTTLNFFCGYLLG